MNQPHSTAASEVFRTAESTLSRAIDVRRRAAELAVQADRLQKEAYAAFIAEFGEEDAPFAYRIACRSLGVDHSDISIPTPAPVAASASLLSQSPPPEMAVVEPRLPPVAAQAQPVASPRPEPESIAPKALPVAPIPVEAPVANPVQTVAVSEPVTAEDPSRLERYGVAVKRSKLAEAEEVIDQARRAAAQNRKSNPYADDRGRNAWRNTLFAAVLSAEGAPSQDGSSVREPVRPARVQEPSEAEPAPAPIRVEDAVAAYDVDDAVLADIEDMDSAMASLEDTGSEAGETDDEASLGSEDIDVHLDLASDVQSSAAPTTVPDPDVLDDDHDTPPPSRSVPFTRNPAQMPTATPRPPFVDTAGQDKPPLSKPSPPFARSVPTSAEKTPKVHVPAPVQNRTLAHGQSVPVPPGLTEHLKTLQSGQASTQEPPSAPIKTPSRPAPTPGPSFLRNK